MHLKKGEVELPFGTNLVKEELSYAYLHAVAARCGFRCVRKQPDVNKVDAQIDCCEDIVPDPKQSEPSIEVQLKSTTIDGIREVRDGVITYDLEVGAYNKCIKVERHMPLLLVLLVLPRDEREWLVNDEEALVKKKCAYWVSLQGRDRSTNDDTIAIDIPRVNIFNCDNLIKIMQKVSMKERIGP